MSAWVYKQFNELEEAVNWMNDNKIYKVTGLLSTPKGIYLVYETNNNNN